MKEKKKTTIHQTAQNLADIMMDHLSTLSPKERGKKIKKGEKIIKKEKAISSCGFSASGSRPTVSRTSKNVPWAARGR